MLKLKGKTFIIRIYEHPDDIVIRECYDSITSDDDWRIVDEWHDAILDRYESDPRSIEWL
jgi:hypothetical protein